MKYTIAFFALIFGFSMPVLAESLDLSAPQQQVILTSLNNLCGDTWCAGEINIEFTGIQFQNDSGYQHYVINFSVQSSYDASATKNAKTCDFKNIQLVQELVTSFNSGAEQSLYEEMSRCLAEQLQTSGQ